MTGRLPCGSAASEGYPRTCAQICTHARTHARTRTPHVCALAAQPRTLYHTHTHASTHTHARTLRTRTHVQISTQGLCSKTSTSMIGTAQPLTYETKHTGLQNASAWARPKLLHSGTGFSALLSLWSTQKPFLSTHFPSNPTRRPVTRRVPTTENVFNSLLESEDVPVDSEDKVTSRGSAVYNVAIDSPPSGADSCRRHPVFCSSSSPPAA